MIIAVTNDTSCLTPVHHLTFSLLVKSKGTSVTTVKPLKKGHFGNFTFVLCRVVLFLEVPLET